MIVNFFENIIEILQSPILLFGIEIFSSLAKIALLIILLAKGLRVIKIPKPLFFLLGVLISGIAVDIAWIIKLWREIFTPTLDYRIIIFVIRLCWAFNLLQFQLFGLLVESLGERQYKIKLHQKLLFFINSCLMGCFIFFAFFYYNKAAISERPSLEFTLMNFSSLYMFLVLVIPSLALTIYKLRIDPFPKILKRQLIILVKYLISPFIISEVIQSFFLYSKHHIYAATSISVPLLTFALYYSTRKIIGLRFLNFQNHVQSTHAFNFIDDFKNVLEQLSQSTSVKELGHINQFFFKEAFKVLSTRVSLYFRKLNNQNDDHVAERSFTEEIVEHFINRHSTDQLIAEYIFNHRILINDEIIFSNFYEENRCRKEIIAFLEQINADIFLPIYDHTTIIAYIIIERYARPQEFYSNVERDEMVVFASYLGNIINLLQNRNLSVLIEKEKKLREELYSKHQEINQYKESIRSFLRDTKQRKIGILFYKNRKFVFGNQAAKELIDVNINILEGHSLTKVLKRIVQQVYDYKTMQTCFAKDSQGNKLVLSALPHIERNNIIITVCYPEASDIIKKQIDLLRNPSEWDYLLYLETTRTGQLINQLIPGSGGILLNFKIDLLKIALSKKAILLDMPEQDLLPTVEILHHISLRETLHVLTLQAHGKNYDIAIKLFGINPILGTTKEEPLLKKLDNLGTLFIQNVHYLDIETQHYLAEFIKYGYCHVFKSDQKISSNVRVICSTNQNLLTLMQEGKFSKALFNELNETTVSMPSLMSLSEEELYDLAEGFTEQAIKSTEFKNVLELTQKEKNRLTYIRPVSLQEFKTKVQQMLLQKSKKNNIYQETQFDPAYHVTDPELIEAVRLGKKALKDPKIMAILWQKFKNQNKIAAFLGVNRSSINRRCKEYNLE